MPGVVTWVARPHVQPQWLLMAAVAMLGVPLWLAAPAAASQPVQVEVRAARHGGSGRLVLDWPHPVELETAPLDDGLRFRAPASFAADLEAARRTLQPWLAAADQQGNELTLRFEPRVRADRLDYAPDLLVLDLRHGEVEALAAATAPRDPAVRIGRHEGFTRLVLDWAAPQEFEVEQRPHDINLVFQRAAALDPDDLRERLERLVDGIEAEDERHLRIRLAERVTARPFLLDDDKLVIDLYPDSQAAPAAGEAAETAEVPASTIGAPDRAEEVPKTPSAAVSTAEAGRSAVHVTASRHARGFELTFLWRELVPAAIFVRGSALWTVFDGMASDVRPQGLTWETEGLSRVLGPGEQIEIDGALALRFPLKISSLVHVKREGSAWRVRLGPSAPASANVAFTAAGPQSVRLRRTDAGRTLEVVDPEVGDMLGIWPLLQPGAVSSARSLVHVEILPSAQGVVWSRRSDRLGALAADGDLLLAPRIHPKRPHLEQRILAAGWRDPPDPPSSEEPADLQMRQPRPSPPKPNPEAARRSLGSEQPAAPDTLNAVLTEPGKPTPERAVAGLAGTRPADVGVAEAQVSILDLASFGPLPGKSFAERRNEALAHVAARPAGAQRRAAQLDFARLLLAHGLAAEALGVLIDAGPAQPAGSARKALEGAAAFLMTRVPKAAAALDDPEFDGDAEIALWRAAIAGQLGQWGRALASLEAAGNTLQTYPPALRLPLGLAAARIQGHAGHAVDAFAILEDLRHAPLSPPDRRRVAFTQGQVYSETGAIEAAVAAWRALEDGTRDRIALEAGLAWRTLEVEAGRLDAEEALQQLLRLRPAWRGHPDEARQLHVLAELHARTDRVATAIRLWQEALSRGPKASLADQIERSKRGALVKALNGGDDWVGPLRAFALFEDFRALVPEGEAGVQVRTRLAKRLLGVDQLDAAGELLREALALSPSDVTRGAVGADLAELWLRYPDAGQAREALRSSDSGKLPEESQRRRALLLARAENGLREPAAALRRLAGIEGDEAARLRARILFDAGRWDEFEVAVRPLIEAAKPDDLPAEQRLWLVKLAIALRASGARAELEELHRRFASRIAGSTEEVPFRLATAAATLAPTSPGAALDRARRQVTSAAAYLAGF